MTIGRGSVPVRPYIRLMFFKHSSEWGFENFERKVNDSITLKKFCRILLDKPAPDSSTLIKLNQKYCEEVIKKLNQKLMKQLTERKIIRNVPEAVTADRGYGAKGNEKSLKAARVKKVAIPAKGKKSKARSELEKSLWFKRLVCWRTWSETKISLLKRKYGLARSLSRGY